MGIKKVALNLSVPPEQVEGLKLLAVANGQSVSEMFRHVARKLLKNPELFDLSPAGIPDKTRKVKAEAT